MPVYEQKNRGKDSKGNAKWKSKYPDEASAWKAIYGQSPQQYVPRDPNFQGQYNDPNNPYLNDQLQRGQTQQEAIQGSYVEPETADWSWMDEARRQQKQFQGLQGTDTRRNPNNAIQMPVNIGSNTAQTLGMLSQMNRNAQQSGLQNLVMGLLRNYGVRAV